MKKVIFSADPGKENFSIAIQVLEDYEPSVEMVILLPIRITELKENSPTPFLEQLKLFVLYIEEVLEKYKPESCIMERFQIRFRTCGSTAEVVNVMLGVVSVLCLKKGIPTKLVIASEWKNHFNKISEVSLEETYKLVKKLPPHIIDSIFIGLYYELKHNHWYTRENILKYCEKLKELFDAGNPKKTVRTKKLQKTSSSLI